MRSAVEGRARDDAGPHLVHQVEHLLVAGVGVLGDAIELQRVGRAAAALVECGDEAGAALGFLELVVVHVCPFFFIRQSSAARSTTRRMAQIPIIAVSRCHTQTDGRSIMTATMHRGYRASRERRSASRRTTGRYRPRDARVLEWDDDLRDGAFATLRRESPITFFEVPEIAGFPRAPAIGRSRGSTTSTMPVVTPRSSARSRQARRSPKCLPRSRSLRVR